MISTGDWNNLKTESALILLIFLGYILAANTLSMQYRVLGIVFLSLVLWSLFPRSHFLSAILVIITLSFYESSIGINQFVNSMFRTYGGSGFWIIISGFILSEGLEVSGLARRLALWIVSGMRSDPSGIVASVALASLAISPLSPSTTAKAFLILPICVNLVEAFKVDKGRSKYGAAVMLMAMAANNICSTGFLTATVPNPISANFIESYSGINLGWVQWLRMAFPLTFVLLLVSWLLCRLMFNPEVRKSDESRMHITSLRSELPPRGREELLVLAIFTISLILVVTERIHGLNAGLISLVLSLTLFLPKIGVIKIGGFAGDIPWGSISLFAASMFLARAITKWQALDPAAMGFFNMLNLSSLSTSQFIVSLIVISMLLHIVFTSTTVYATVMVPLAISLATLQGIQTQYASIPLAFMTPIAVVLPVNTIPNIVFYKTGYFTQQEMVKYGLILSVISTILVIVLGLPYWRFIGLL